MFIYNEKGTPIGLDPRAADAYNCHSFAWYNSQGDPNDAQTPPYAPKWDEDPLNNTGDYRALSFNEKNQVGDRVMYFNVDDKGNVVPTHSAIVTKVDKNGNTIEVESKWGQDGVYIHHPRDVPDGYNQPGANPTFEANGHVYESRVYFRKDILKAMSNPNTNDIQLRFINKPVIDHTKLVIPNAPPYQRYNIQTYFIKPIK
jgi:hypothetical protein